ncbi:hypothetical protein TIFTF001_014891 [Ficus carica]|uniref:Secreted protein n=1 Tax=Ficus carica TaxID=3494 RepID=A0AA88AGV1_FICCA|nr:hypothetical protein TIFTF001_014891 [Ficus carica]
MLSLSLSLSLFLALIYHRRCSPVTDGGEGSRRLRGCSRRILGSPRCGDKVRKRSIFGLWEGGNIRALRSIALRLLRFATDEDPRI